MLAQVLGDEAHEVLDVLGLAREGLAQDGILSRDSDRASVEIAGSHHHAAEGDEGGGREAEFLGAEEGRDGHVPSRHELAVGLDGDAGAEVVEKQGLVGFGEAELPGQARMPQRSPWRGARPAVVARDEDDVGAGLGDAGRDGADADLRDELDRYPRVGIGALEVVDELGEVLDGVDIVMGRRGDEPDAGGGLAALRDPGIDLASGQLAALARLGPLGHLDLYFLGAYEVFARHAEAAGGDLLDGAATRVSVRVGQEALGVLPALARIALAPEAVHGDRHRLVSLLADGSEGHGARLETLHDGGDLLDLVDGNRLGILEFHETAKRALPRRLVVDQRRIPLEGLVVALPARPLEKMDGLGIVEVVLAVLAPLPVPADGEGAVVRRALVEGGGMALLDLDGEILDPDAADPRGRAREVSVDEGRG